MPFAGALALASDSNIAMFVWYMLGHVWMVDVSVSATGSF
jgi:hypothetical protein